MILAIVLAAAIAEAPPAPPPSLESLFEFNEEPPELRRCRVYRCGLPPFPDLKEREQDKK